MPEGHELLLDEDERQLASLGYTQELHRSWSGFSNFAISFSIISILAGCFTSFGLGWNNGGPAAIAWGWPICRVFILLIGPCMSELVSAFPTSGGIYWWAAKLGGAAAGADEQDFRGRQSWQREFAAGEPQGGCPSRA